MSSAYKFNSAGRLVTVLSGAAVAPLAVSGVLTFDANGALLIVSSGAVPDAVANNWPLSPTGELKVNITDTPLAGPVQASLTRAVGASQQIWCSANNAIASWSEGLPFDAGGNLCTGADDVAVVTDPNFASVVALLHFDGTNGSTVVPNSSPRGSTWACGSGVTLSTTGPQYGTACLNCAAANAGLTSTSPDYVIGTGDFTVEFSMYWTAKADSYVFDMGNAATFFRIDAAAAGGNAYVEIGGVGWATGSAAGVNLTINTWHQLAVSRVSGVGYFFLDGVKKDSAAMGQNFGGSQLSLGKSISAGFPATCKIDEFRLTKGVGRYTGNYAVATAPFPDS